MLTCRRASPDDVMLYYDWTNDEEVRKQSFHSEPVKLGDHRTWFSQRLAEENTMLLVFENENKQPVGQVRFQKENEEGVVIGISIDKRYRNKGLASTMLTLATDNFFEMHPSKKIYAYIKKANTFSVKAFEKAGFTFFANQEMEGVPSMCYIKIKGNEN